MPVGHPKDERGKFQRTVNVRVTLGPKKLLELVNRYLQECRTRDGRPHVGKVLKKLGWKDYQWQLFREKHEGQLIMEKEINYTVIETDEVRESDGITVALQARGIPPEEVQHKLHNSFAALRAELSTMGLSVAEINGCVAMQNFGENRFANAMEIISSGVFKTAVKLDTELQRIQGRLKDVRAVIEEYGSMVCEQRDGFVREESDLVKQMTLVGKLLSDIQKTWYEGSAQLALVRMRLRNEGSSLTHPNSTQRSNKPGFTPKIMEAQVSVTPVPEP